ncbi:MAG: DUF3052 family protein [Candidatus Sulfotelmatobacter sp.]
MPGYSATPLPRKLGIKAGFRVQLVSAPADVLAELREALANCAVARDGKRKGSNNGDHDPLDFAMIFTKSQSELKRKFRRLAKLLQPAGMLWVSWPKKSSGVASDLDDNRVREIGLAAGLVDVKVCAVTEVWSGLKFVRRVKDRT